MYFYKLACFCCTDNSKNIVKRVSDGMDKYKKTTSSVSGKESTRKKITTKEVIIALVCCLADFGIAQFGLLTLIQKAYSFLAYLAIPVILIPYVIHMVVTRFDTK